MDVTVILVFLGLMKHGKTTLVAEDLGVTQPAISHALKRLRTIYNDPLFFRVPHGLEPTAVAKDLEPLFQDALETLAKSLQGPKEFDPASYAHPLRIAGCEFLLGKILPKLLAKSSEFGSEAPIRAMRLPNDLPLAELDNDSADLAVGYFSGLPEKYLRERLFADECCLVAGARHPVFEADATPEFLAGQSYVKIEGASSCDQVLDNALSERGLYRDSRASAPLVHPAFAALRSGDFLAAVPMRVAEEFGSSYGLSFRTLPFKTDEVAASAVWHAKNEKSPLIEWLMPLVRSAIDPEIRS